MFYILKIKHHIHRTYTKEYIGKNLNGLEMRKKKLNLIIMKAMINENLYKKDYIKI